MKIKAISDCEVTAIDYDGIGVTVRTLDKRNYVYYPRLQNIKIRRGDKIKKGKILGER